MMGTPTLLLSYIVHLLNTDMAHYNRVHVHSPIRVHLVMCNLQWIEYKSTFTVSSLLIEQNAHLQNRSQKLKDVQGWMNLPQLTIFKLANLPCNMDSILMCCLQKGYMLLWLTNFTPTLLLWYICLPMGSGRPHRWCLSPFFVLLLQSSCECTWLWQL